MPIHLGKDSDGPFVQWGHQKKYHYKANDKKSLAAAKAKAKKQMKAIFSSGYVGENVQIPNEMKKSKFDLVYEDIVKQLSTQIVKHNKENIYFHISPFKFNKFQLSKCGAGMGTSFWGYGIYFAKNEETINYYYEQMKDSYKNLFKYTVEINCRTINDVWHDYRHKHIPQNKSQKLIYDQNDLLANDETVGQIYYKLVEKYNQKKASQIILQKYGVAGITYYTEEDSSSLVIFDEDIIKILNVQEFHDEK